MTDALPLDPRTARILPWIIAIAFFMQMLDGTILNTALPAMARDLNENPLNMQSVIIAYMLTVALLIPASGWIADRFGARRIFYSAIALFSLGSLFCALSQTLDQLVLSRIVQGVGGALMLPVGRLVILRAYPRTELVRILSFIALPGLLGPLLGPALGGWLVEVASWHWIFLINLPVGVLGIWAARRYIPDLRAPEKHRFDLPGFILFASALGMITIALEALSGHSVSNLHITLLLVLGLALLAIYWLRAGRVEHPLFSTDLFTHRSFSAGILGNLLARLGSGALPFLTPLLLQVGMGYSPAQAGMTMIPLALGAMAAKPIIKPLIDRFGYRYVLSTNTMLVGLLIASMALVGDHTSTAQLLIQLGLIGMANSIQFASMNTLTLIDLHDHQASSGNSMLSAVVQLSMSIGVAIGGALLSGFEGHLDNLHRSFQATYICLGLMSMLATAIFFQLDPHNGRKTRSVEPQTLE